MIPAATPPFRLMEGTVRFPSSPFHANEQIPKKLLSVAIRGQTIDL
jgi:hypothetical protein